MPLENRIRRGLMIAALAAAAQAGASDYTFMTDTPYSYFSKEDHALFDATLDDVLAKGAVGDSRTWSNPKSKAGGEIKMLKNYERAGVTCRTLFIANKAKGRAASGKYNFCPKEAGGWQLTR
jgi:surface antigen